MDVEKTSRRLSDTRVAWFSSVRPDNRVSIAIDGSAPESLVALAVVEVFDDVNGHSSVAAAFARKYDGFDIADVSVAGPLVLMRVRITRWLLDGSPQ
ncbi:hypothetical protein NVV95_06365 [Herbiconiux sp. CPCC 205716]|uniref:Uncharacterized protein n=1 Tax=Herbiconiux gentiana TaxID=2970912 RepID=A0ABT2GD76_9MICO|nr:hypothetical protein [Herbiconiux gentiana]MCS5714174.1 hypothetical protein [Herbiconiux gentiana]